MAFGVVATGSMKPMLAAMAAGSMRSAGSIFRPLAAAAKMGISNTATAAMMLPLTVGILSPLDADKDRRTFSFVLLGVAYAASIGGIGTLVGSPPNAIAARAADIDFMTIGQYLQPTPKHHRVDRFVTPDEFKSYEKAAYGKGFLMVSATPLTRSS